ncbi:MULTISPECIES: FecR family protein [Chitinophagaceae]
MEDFRILLEKFWAGETSELEKMKLYRMLSDKGNAEKWKQYFEKEQEAFPLNQKQLDKEEVSMILEYLHEKIREGANSTETKSKNFYMFWKLSVAACLTIVFLLYWHMQRSRMGISTIVKNTFPEQVLDDSTIENHGMAKQRIVLPDATVVVLSNNSSIRFKKMLVAQNRKTVYLKGAANFSVQHDERHLFEVITDDIRTLDVGTVFYIDAYHKRKVNIRLLEGRIMVQPLEKSSLRFHPRYMEPGEELHIDLDSKKLSTAHFGDKVKTSANAAVDSLATTDTKQLSNKYMDNYTDIAFTKEKLITVFKRMEMLYHVKIRLQATASEDLAFTGTLVGIDPLDKSLDVICGLSGFHYMVDKNGTILVYKSENNN